MPLVVALVALMLALLAILCLGSLLTIDANDTDPVRVRVVPRVAFAPSDVRVYVRIRPVESDRWLHVEADSVNGMRRSSTWTLEGSDSPTYWHVEWRDLTAGDYEIRASIGVGDRLRASARETIRLLGSDAP